MKVNKNKWVVGATSAALVASAIVPVASAANFSDIEKNDHKDAILALAEAGIVSGYTDGTFKPNAVVTRGNVTKLLGKWLVSEGYKIPENFETEVRFTDLPVTSADKELVKYAALVKDAKVFNGSNNNLMHTKDMNREQMALVLVRAIKTVYGVDLIADYKAAKFESKITDLEKASADENREAITALEYAKLTTVTAFNPKNSLTRGQFASFLNRAIVNLAKEEVELTVKSVTVKDATTLEVTLSDDKKHTVKLEKALPENEETTVDFVINEKTYSAKVTYVVDKLKIGSVTAINDKTVEVKFTKEIDKEFIREAEKSGKYFAIYKNGESIRGDIAQSNSISFAADGKSAEFVLKKDSKIESGKQYYVAMLDGETASVANVVLSYGPTELRKAAEQPEFEVSAVSEKITIKFNAKMKNSALSVSNYEVYDNGGKKVGNLNEFVVEKTNGDWVNAITKKDVEFTLNSAEKAKKLSAGKSYKIMLVNNLETDDNKTLNKEDLVITVNTPSVEAAAPKVTSARVLDENHITLVFDKDVSAVNLNNLNNLVEITTATGKKVNTSTIRGAINTNFPNEVNLTLTVASTPDKLDRGTTYNVEIPANIITNAVFPNAVNKAVTSIKATAQDNTPIKAMSAKLVTNEKDRKQADLVLTFDQRPTIDSVKQAIKTSALTIIDGEDTYVYGTGYKAGGDFVVKYVGNDTTGKSVVIGNVNAKNFFKFGEESFAPNGSESYTVEAKAGSIKVDAFVGQGATNQSKLRSTINGIAVSAPVVDRITLESAEKMVIEFKEDISSEVDLNKITVAGFEANQNNFYEAEELTGSGNFESTVVGNKLTLTAKKGVKFVTGTEEIKGLTKLIDFQENAIVSKNSAISMRASDIDFGMIVAGKVDGVKVVDNAAPVLLFASENGNKTDLKFTFTENIKVTGDAAGQFRTGGDAAKASVGSTVDTTPLNTTPSNTLNVTFTNDWKNADTTLLQVTSEYRTGQTIYIADAFGNKVATTKLTGVKKGIVQILPPAFDDLKAAIDAVDKAEKSKDQEDVEAAKTLVDALPENQYKTDLLTKLEVVTAAVISNVSISSSNPNKSKAVKGDKITLTFTTNKKVEKTADFKINGKAIDQLVELNNKSDLYTYTVVYTVVEGVKAEEVKFQINVQTENGVLSSTVEKTNDSSFVMITAS